MSDTTRWVVKARLGDRAALDELLRRSQEWLWGYVVGLVGDPDLAADVLQEALWSVCRKLGSLRDPESYRAWTYRIAARAAWRALRRRSRQWEREGAELEEDVASAEPGIGDPLIRRRLRRRVAELPPRTRAVFLLHYFEDLALREAAEVLGVPFGTVKSRLAYGLERLRARLPRMEGSRHA